MAGMGSSCGLMKATLAVLALLLSLCGGAQAQAPGGFEAALLDALRASALLRWKDAHLYTPAARRAALCAEFFGAVERDQCLDWHNDKVQAEQRLAKGIAALGLGVRVRAMGRLVMQVGGQDHEQALRRDPVYALLYAVADDLVDGHGGPELARCGEEDVCVIVFEFDRAGALSGVWGEVVRPVQDGSAGVVLKKYSFQRLYSKV